MKFEAKVTYELIDAVGMKNDPALWSYMKWLPEMIQNKGNTITALSVCRVGFLYKFEYADGSLHEGFSALVSPILVKYFKRVDPVVIEARLEVPPKENKEEVFVDYSKFLKARQEYKNKMLNSIVDINKLFPAKSDSIGSTFETKTLKAQYDPVYAEQLRKEHAEDMSVLWEELRRELFGDEVLQAFEPERRWMPELTEKDMNHRFVVQSARMPLSVVCA